jgi:hypothetical protein
MEQEKALLFLHLKNAHCDRFEYGASELNINNNILELDLFNKIDSSDVNKQCKVAVYWKFNNFDLLENTLISIKYGDAQFDYKNLWYFNGVQAYTFLEHCFDDKTTCMYSFSFHPTELENSLYTKSNEFIIKVKLDENINLSSNKYSISTIVQYLMNNEL